MICSSCYAECSTVTVKDGFHYDYGDICNAWHDESYEGSDCCGEEACEGSIYLNRTTTHIARKDHLNSNGKVIVAKGQRYNYRITKGYIVRDGTHEGIFEIKKWVTK